MSNTLRFLYITGVYVIPNFLVASIFVALLDSGPIDDTFDRHGILWSLIIGVLIAPVVETLLLLWSARIAEKYIRSSNRWVLSVAGAAPLIALHGFISYQKIFVVAWGFIWLTYCSFELRTRNTWFNVLLVLSGVHSIVNAVAILHIYYFD